MHYEAFRNTVNSREAGHSHTVLAGLEAEVVRLTLDVENLAWEVDEHDGCDEGLMILLTPPGEEDETPSFVISGTEEGFMLSSVFREEYREHGEFGLLSELVATARSLLEATLDGMACMN